MKFGGTSVANCEAITRTIGIIESKLEKKPVVVVSAVSAAAVAAFAFRQEIEIGPAWTLFFKIGHVPHQFILDRSQFPGIGIC